MPFILFFLFTLIPVNLQAESNADEYAMRMMQANAEERKLNDDLASPKQPELSKKRAFWGERNAQIIVVEYSDFECPFCKRGWETVEALKKKHGKKLGFQFKHLPLPFHSMAMPTAKYFEAIAMQSSKKAYDFHDRIFRQQELLGSQKEKFLEDTAKAVGANMAKLKKDLDSPEVKSRIEADMAEAKAFGFSGTPGFLVSGVRVAGAYPVEHFDKIIERRLASH